MKLVILAGGLGTRLSEETVSKPKPMVEIGGKPLIWHIMKIYSQHGINEFIICLGYKGYVIKEFFGNYFLHTSDLTIDIKNNKREIHSSKGEPWKITLVETGDNTMTGGRLKRIKDYIGDEDFCFTYGDGLSDLDITKEIKFHKSHGKLATITSVQPQGRFGKIIFEGERVIGFSEKVKGDGSYVNGGFFVLNKKCLDFIEGDHISWEKEPLEKISKMNELVSFKHDGFWQPVDTLRDKNQMQDLWNQNKAPWKTWE